MSLSQALSAALAGVNVTQQGLSVIAGNVANANTTGYIDETLSPVEVASGGYAAAKPALDRELRRLLCRRHVTALSAAPANLRHAWIVDVIRRDLQ
jgi:flagellar hook-associated protein 1